MLEGQYMLVRWTNGLLAEDQVRDLVVPGGQKDMVVHIQWLQMIWGNNLEAEA